MARWQLQDGETEIMSVKPSMTKLLLMLLVTLGLAFTGTNLGTAGAPTSTRMLSPPLPASPFRLIEPRRTRPARLTGSSASVSASRLQGWRLCVQRLRHRLRIAEAGAPTDRYLSQFTSDRGSFCRWRDSCPMPHTKPCRVSFRRGC